MHVLGHEGERHQSAVLDFASFINALGQPSSPRIIAEQWFSPVVRKRQFVQITRLVKMLDPFPMRLVVVGHLTAPDE